MSRRSAISSRPPARSRAFAPARRCVRCGHVLFGDIGQLNSPRAAALRVDPRAAMSVRDEHRHFAVLNCAARECGRPALVTVNRGRGNAARSSFSEAIRPCSCADDQHLLQLFVDEMGSARRALVFRDMYRFAHALGAVLRAGLDRRDCRQRMASALTRRRRRERAALAAASA